MRLNSQFFWQNFFSRLSKMYSYSPRDVSVAFFGKKYFPSKNFNTLSFSNLERKSNDPLAKLLRKFLRFKGPCVRRIVWKKNTLFQRKSTFKVIFTYLQRNFFELPMKSFQHWGTVRGKKFPCCKNYYTSYHFQTSIEISPSFGWFFWQGCQGCFIRLKRNKFEKKNRKVPNFFRKKTDIGKECAPFCRNFALDVFSLAVYEPKK